MAKDRYKYFRVEARELLEGLSRGVLGLESSAHDKELVARLLRQAHTLKGAARVVQQNAIGDLAHAAEDALGPHRDPGSPPVPRASVDALLRILDEAAAHVAALEPPPPEAEAGAAAVPDDALRTVRVDVAEMQAVLDSVLEAGVQTNALRSELARLDRAQEVVTALADQLSVRRPEGDGRVGAAHRLHPLVDELRRTLDDARRVLDTHAERSEREIAHLRNSADRLRLVPARAVFGAMERAARDAARMLDRPIAFETSGGDARVEANVLSLLREALLHVVRNAVAHGIEPAGERTRRGKPALGTVRLEVERRGNRVAFVCRDDGRGIDGDAVREAAVRKGLLRPEEAATLRGEALGELLLRGGLSTSESVSEISGRGVGLDIVRDTAARLNAQVTIRSEPGEGTAMEIAVPVSLAAMTCLQLEVGDAVVAVPLEAVRRAMFLDPKRVVSTPNGAAISHEGQRIPFAPLPAILGQAPAPGPRRFWSAVIVRSGSRLVAAGADRLRGTIDMVVRPLPAFLEANPAIGGASLDAEGNPRLVLDPTGLAATIDAGGSWEERRPAARAPILVIDDSLTTRMLEQSILQSAGYEVEVAVSAEDALDKCRNRRFGLFLVDIEMPGMDGLEFVRVTRADPRQTTVPAVVLTSRGAPEDRQRGREAGASAYIVKSEFDQGRLLATVKELLG